MSSPLSTPAPVWGLLRVDNPPPPFVEPFVQRGRTLLIVLVWVTAGIGLVGGGFLAAVAGNPSGAGLAVVYSLVPLPLLLLAYWWLDRVEPEPFRYKAAAFVWGAVIAVLLALALELGLAWLGVNNDWMIAVVAPIVEEAAKGAFLLLTLLRARRIINGMLDGVIVAGLVAIGFASVENLGYYAASYLGLGDDFPISGASAVTLTFVVRGLFSPFAHPLFTAVLGLALGFAATRQHRWQQWVLVILGYLGSVLLHALWNGSLVVTGGAGFVVAYLLLAMLLLLLAVVVVFIRIHEHDVLAKSLRQIGARGWLHPAEIGYLVKFARRRQAREFAKIHGPHALKAMKRYQKLATEVGFLHDAVMRGRALPDGRERTYALLDQMWILRPWLRFPPALPPALQ